MWSYNTLLTKSNQNIFSSAYVECDFEDGYRCIGRQMGNGWSLKRASSHNSSSRLPSVDATGMVRTNIVYHVRSLK